MPGSALLGKLSERFGQNIIKDDGSLDRRLLRQIAFDKSHPENLNDLNALMAPAIEDETVRQVQEKLPLMSLSVFLCSLSIILNIW